MTIIIIIIIIIITMMIIIVIIIIMLCEIKYFSLFGLNLVLVSCSLTLSLTCAHTLTQKHSLTPTHSHAHTLTHSLTNTHTPNTHTHTNSLTCTHTPTHTHAPTHSLTCTHTLSMPACIFQNYKILNSVNHRKIEPLPPHRHDCKHSFTKLHLNQAPIGLLRYEECTSVKNRRHRSNCHRYRELCRPPTPAHACIHVGFFDLTQVQTLGSHNVRLALD